MKKPIKILTAIFLLLFLTYSSYAHDPKKHKKTDEQEAIEDTLTHQQDSTAIVETSDQPQDQDIKEVTIVNANLSDFPTLHPLMVHFPIVFLILALFAQLAGLFLWKNQLSLITGILLIGGFGGALLVSTIFHPHTSGLSDAAQQVLDLHDRFAHYTIWGSGIALFLKVLSHFLFQKKLWMEILVIAALIGCTFFISKTGHYGATLVHLHGVGPQGDYLEVEDHGH